MERSSQLTDELFWDQYWSSITLPREMTKSKSLYAYEILDVFDRYLPHGPHLTTLEIGGAPGQYLAYLHRNLHYEIHVLELSSIGCEKTIENFELLGIPGTVHAGDLFSDQVALPKFDVVYSLGLIEHFSDTVKVVERHLRFLKPGGLLVLGCPNFRGINGMFLKHLEPKLYGLHDLRVMDVRTWTEFEQRHQLTRLFRGYVGGFEPNVFARAEVPTRSTRMFVKTAHRLGNLMNREGLHGLRKFNSGIWSGYAMGVYQSQLEHR